MLTNGVIVHDMAKVVRIVRAPIARRTAKGCLSQTPASGSARSKFRDEEQMRVLGIVVMQAKVARLNGLCCLAN